MEDLEVSPPSVSSSSSPPDSSRSRRFLLLDDSVTAEILGFLILDDLVTVSRVCKRLREIVQARTSSFLWHLSYNCLIFTKLPYLSHVNWHEKVAEVSSLISGYPLVITKLESTTKPKSRAGHSLALFYDKYLLLFGGMSHFNSFPTGYTFINLTDNTVLESASFLGSSPGPRWLHSTSVIKDEENEEVAIIFGGSYNGIFLNDVYLIRMILSSDGDNPDRKVEHIVSEELVIRGTKPSKRCGHSADSICQRKIIVFGGLGADSVCLNDLYEVWCL